MSMSSRVVLFLLHNVFWFLLNCNTCYGVASDIQCLKTLKTQLKDPNNYLSSWDLNNSTEGAICKFNGIECWHTDESRVQNVRLSNMGLEGQLPFGLKNCTSITGLDLSNNNLSGSLPSNIDEIIPFVTTLDFSFNKFSGELPLKLGNLTYLNVLNLEHNQFTGQIPWLFGLLNRLTTLNVADNRLSGPIPTFINKTFAPVYFANNIGLCGKPLDECNAPPNHIGLCGKPSDECKGPPRKSLSAGNPWILFAILVTVVPFCVLCRPSRKSNAEDIEGKNQPTRKRSTDIKESQVSTDIKESQVHFTDAMVSELGKSVPKMRLFDLKKATDNFSRNNIIGSGRTGTMYKGILSDGSVLAIRRLQEPHHSDKYFTSELMTLGSTRHPNLAPLLGFCITRKERLLVYRYMPRKSLYENLYHADSETKWPLRLKISIGVARGLAWLHHHCNPRIVHRNVKSKCILLDDDYEPKISDFGFARLMNLDGSHVDTHLDRRMRNLVYVAPEYKCGLVPTSMGDVYSFGMLLLELVTSRLPTQITIEPKYVKGNLGQWLALLSESYPIDESLIERGCRGELLEVFRVACACVVPVPEERPTMLEVHKLLRAVGKKYGFEDEDEINIAEQFPVN